jgi:hypothetical protein
MSTGSLAMRPARDRAFRLSAPAVTFLAGCAAAVFLVLWPDYLPMVDAPNHLARLTIIAAPDDSPLRRMYSVSWGLIPDLGLDLVFLALKSVASPAFVMRLCVLAAVVTILGSACAIQKSIFGRLSWSVAFVPIFIFGLVWLVGLINYMMGVGVALAGLAVFIRGDRRLDPWRGLLLGAFGVIALMCHVAAFAAFMLLLSSLSCAEELAAPSRAAALPFLRKGWRLLLVFLPGILLYALCEKPARSWGVNYTLRQKLLLPLHAVFGSATYADIVVGILALAVFLLLGACGGLRVWRPARPALVMLAAAILLVPCQIDNAMEIDARLTLVLTVAGLSMTEIRHPLRGLRPGIVVACMAALLGFRVHTMLVVEDRYDSDVKDFRAAMQAVDGSPKILVAKDAHTLADCTRSAVEQGDAGLHSFLGSFLTIDRNAFTQLIFAGRGMQPIRARGDYAAISSPASLPVPVHILQLAEDPAKAPRVDALLRQSFLDRFVLDWRRDFDAMLVLHLGCARNPFPGELTPLIEGRFFTLYRIDRPGDS